MLSNKILEHLKTYITNKQKIDPYIIFDLIRFEFNENLGFTPRMGANNFKENLKELLNKLNNSYLENKNSSIFLKILSKASLFWFNEDFFTINNTSTIIRIIEKQLEKFCINQKNTNFYSLDFIDINDKNIVYIAYETLSAFINNGDIFTELTPRPPIILQIGDDFFGSY